MHIIAFLFVAFAAIFDGTPLTTAAARGPAAPQLALTPASCTWVCGDDFGPCGPALGCECECIQF